MLFTLKQVGADSIMLYFGTQPSEQTIATIGAATKALEVALHDELIDLIPSFTSLLLIYDCVRHSHVDIAAKVRSALDSLPAAALSQGKTIVLPAFYATEAGQDLEQVAEQACLGVDDVIALHSQCCYRVYAIGFAPGFAYLGDVDSRIALPRKSTPRVGVPRGSIAIAERQTAVYPQQSPGGWNLIGLCPTNLFDPDNKPHMPMEVGDTVRFEPISRADFLRLGGSLP